MLTIEPSNQVKVIVFRFCDIRHSSSKLKKYSTEIAPLGIKLSIVLNVTFNYDAKNKNVNRISKPISLWTKIPYGVLFSIVTHDKIYDKYISMQSAAKPKINCIFITLIAN